MHLISRISIVTLLFFLSSIMVFQPIAYAKGPYASIELSKIATISGSTITGEITITCTSKIDAEITSVSDWLEVHYPRSPDWQKVVDIPLDVDTPLTLAPNATMAITYSYLVTPELAEACEGANSMRNVVSVQLENSHHKGTNAPYISRSESFKPPTLEYIEEVRITEIMFDPEGDDAGEEWVELYNRGDNPQNLGGWSISNRTGQIAATLPAWVLPPDSYVVVHFGVGTDDNDFSDREGDYYTGGTEIYDNVEDECTLYAGIPSTATIVDFVSWCFDFDYNPGVAHDYAVNAGMWSSGDYYQIYESPYQGIKGFDVKEGDTIGRNEESLDTDRSYDWNNRGGYNAMGPTPGLRNVYPVILDVAAVSTKPNHIYDTTRSPDGFRGSTADNLGQIWFQSLDGQGAGQEITVTVTWVSAAMKDWMYSAVFDDPGSGWIPDTDGTVSHTWNVGVGEGDSTLEIIVRDENGKTDVISIDFRVDNTPPGTPTNVQARPDGYDTVGDKDDDLQIFLTWNNTNDGSGSGIRTYLAKIEDDTPDKDAGIDERDEDIAEAIGEVTYYIRAIDNVGNYGSTGSDTITLNVKPIILSAYISSTNPEHVNNETRPPDYLIESTADNLGTCWFQSVDGEGAGQWITVSVWVTDDNLKDFKCSPLFGVPSPGWLPLDPVPWIQSLSMEAKIDAGEGDDILTITIRDEDGSEDAITIDFKVDNTDPEKPTDAQCRPDSYTDVGETDDDRGIFFTWKNATDVGSGIRNYYAELDDPNPTEEVGLDEKDFAVSNNSGLVTYYVRARDNVGNWGNTDNDTITITNANPAVDLGIAPQQQKKDTKMLALDGALEKGDHCWDTEHPGLGCPICNYNCWAASISMINSMYHNGEKRLFQDRIRYEGHGASEETNNDTDDDDVAPYKHGAPEQDFLWGVNLADSTPGLWPSDFQPLLAWALGVAEANTTWIDINGTYKAAGPMLTFAQVRNLIDHQVAIARMDRRHCTIVDGYRENGGQFVHFINPWNKSASWVKYGDWVNGSNVTGSPTRWLFYLNIGVETKPRSDENADKDDTPDTMDDSDCDGIVDFDEYEGLFGRNRFYTSKNDMDSDGDGVPDKQEVREYIFDNAGNYSRRDPDIDKDDLRKEVDEDNDNDGKKDGEEDKNKNGKYEPVFGESDNFDAASNDPKPFKWLIMVYMAAEDGLDDAAFKDINEMEKEGSDGDVGVVVQVDFMTRFKGKTRRYFIEKDDDEDEITSTILMDCVEKNMGDPATLEEFVKWAENGFAADKYTLIIWDRGYGWKGVAHDVISGDDFLYIGELWQASIMFPKHLDIIGFDAGLMAMIEVGYQLSDFADIMVASEDQIDIDGWPYDTILNELKANADWDGATLAKKIVELYHDYYTNVEPDPFHTLSAINLGDDFLNLVIMVDTFGNQLGEGTTSVAEDAGMEDYDKDFVEHYDPDDNVQIRVKDDLRITEHYGQQPGGDPNYIDLRHFAENILADGGIVDEWKSAAPQIVALLEKEGPIVIAEEHGDMHEPNSHGLSIYFPSAQTKYPPPVPKDNAAIDEKPFDDPSPSRIDTPESPLAIYAEDHVPWEWGKVPYIGPPPHPLPETPNFFFPEFTQWDEFLHRYYKPCADAGEDQLVPCDLESKLAIIVLDGSGSSDADGTVTRYFWDLNDMVSTDANDWDRDGIDETNDDNDVEGMIVAVAIGAGIHTVTLTVWDDHNLLGTDHLGNDHSEHWKTDQDQMMVTADCCPPQNEDGYPKVIDIAEPELKGVFTVTIRDRVFDPLCDTGELHQPIGRIEKVEVWLDETVIFEADDINEPIYDFKFMVELLPGPIPDFEPPEMHRLTIHAWDWVNKHMEKPVDIIHILDMLQETNDLP